MKLNFTDVGKLPPPVLQFINVTFGYSPDRVLYSNVSLALVLTSLSSHRSVECTQMAACQQCCSRSQCPCPLRVSPYRCC